MSLDKCFVDIIANFAFGRKLREQQQRGVENKYIAKGIRKLARYGHFCMCPTEQGFPPPGVGYVGNYPYTIRVENADLAMDANDRIVGTACMNQRQAIRELRDNLLGDRDMWCAWTKGGDKCGDYPRELLVQGLMLHIEQSRP